MNYKDSVDFMIQRPLKDDSDTKSFDFHDECDNETRFNNFEALCKSLNEAYTSNSRDIIVYINSLGIFFDRERFYLTKHPKFLQNLQRVLSSYNIIDILWETLQPSYIQQNFSLFQYTIFLLTIFSTYYKSFMESLLSFKRFFPLLFEYFIDIENYSFNSNVYTNILRYMIQTISIESKYEDKFPHFSENFDVSIIKFLNSVTNHRSMVQTILSIEFISLLVKESPEIFTENGTKIILNFIHEKLDANTFFWSSKFAIDIINLHPEISSLIFENFQNFFQHFTSLDFSSIESGYKLLSVLVLQLDDESVLNLIKSYSYFSDDVKTCLEDANKVEYVLVFLTSCTLRFLNLKNRLILLLDLILIPIGLEISTVIRNLCYRYENLNSRAKEEICVFLASLSNLNLFLLKKVKRFFKSSMICDIIVGGSQRSIKSALTIILNSIRMLKNESQEEFMILLHEYEEEGINEEVGSLSDQENENGILANMIIEEINC